MSSIFAGFLTEAQEFAFRNYDLENGLPSAEVYDVFQDSRGIIWLATGNGISRYDGYSFDNYSQKDGLTDNVVFEFFEDQKNRIWLRNSTGSADHIFQDEIFAHPQSSQLVDNIKGEVVNSIYVDRANYNYLWPKQ